MKKRYFILANVFGFVTFFGTGYFFLTDGKASAAYSLIPLALCLASYMLYLREKD